MKVLMAKYQFLNILTACKSACSLLCLRFLVVFKKNGIKLCVKLTVLTKDPNFVTELSSAVYTDQPSGSK